jgi:D-glycero-alpha-D-manno-heptose-7-phosphate kinase
MRTNPTTWRASAPVRTADIGGWTDTWFAGVGAVCNIAIDHRARVTIVHDPDARPTVDLALAITGERYSFQPEAAPGRHAIIEHAVAAAMPSGSVAITIDDSIEPGSGLGTSAAVMVALVAALLACGGHVLDPADIAARAHRYETSTGKQSGVQDHWASSFGGISLLTVDYPAAVRTSVAVSQATTAELGRRLHTVYLGSPHTSSALHDEVIARLEAQRAPCLDDMRAAAHAAAAALTEGDLVAYGAALMAHHQAVHSMHPGLIGRDALELVQLARRFGASGWKVNGAGGEGGSMVVLGPSSDVDNAALIAAIAAHSSWRVIPASLGAGGVRVEQQLSNTRISPVGERVG